MEESRAGKKSNRVSPSSHLTPANWKTTNRKHNSKEHDQINSGYQELAIDETTTRDVRASSSSSLSLSFFSESDQAEAPSTSGCSSEMATVMQSKQRKKEKAKEFMKKLKSMLPVKERKVKMDTLSTLEQVVNNMKRLSEGQDRDGEFKSPHIYTGTFHSLDADKLQQSDMYISVSLKNHVVQTASASLMTQLGYPANWWKGRLLRDFLSKNDINTVNGCLAHLSKEELEPAKYSGDASRTSSQGSKYFFARIRRFRKLSEGFSLQNLVSYCPFVMTVTMTRLDESDKDSGSTGFGCGRVKSSLVVYCHPLTSAYSDDGSLPAERQFSLRHSPSCKYTDVEPSAIALLGHLPQDFNAKSIFDLYHPDDYPKLLEIHKKVVQSKGKPFKTDNIRLKTRNNCYIELETEWSSFTNPWTTRLEFIIGQHTVKKGPIRPDVFEDLSPMLSVEAKELTAEDRKTQEAIMEILQKPVQDIFTQPAPRPPVKDQASAQKRNISQVDVVDNKTKPGKERPKVYFQAQDKGEQYTVLDEKGISSIYNQLNYSYNIKRFLLSHPKPFTSNTSDEDSTPERADSGEDQMHADEEMPLELPVVKSSSCGSSTQVHVSEQGHGEEMMSPSAFDDETVGQTSVVVPPKEVTADNIQVLTEESLKKHTKVQELLYLQKIAEEQPLLLNMRRIKRYQNPPQKRHWPGETKEEVDKAKHPCTNSGIFRSSSNLFMQSFPPVTSCDESTATMSTPTQLFHQSSIVIPFTGQGVLASQSMAGMSTTAVINPPPIPLVAVNAPSMGSLVPRAIQAIGPLGVEDRTVPQPMMAGIQPQNIQWPYYPQPGYTLLPQVMGGFYRPILQPVALGMSHQSAGVTMGKTPENLEAQPTPTGNLPQHNMASNKGKQTEFGVARQEADPMISSDETGSSIMYLLEADSSTMFEDSDNKKADSSPPKPGMAPTGHKPVRCAEPPWLRGVKWNNNVKLRYQMPQSRLKSVLKKDEKMLKKYQQADTALGSLEQLLEDISLPGYDEACDEGTDFMFFPKDQLMGDDSDGHRHMMDDLFMEVDMTMSHMMEDDHERKGDDKGGGGGGNGDGGGGGGQRMRGKKNTDNVIWEMRELESQELSQSQHHEGASASDSAVVSLTKEEAGNGTDSSNNTLTSDKEDKAMTPDNDNKVSETELPAMETTKVYMPTAQVEELNTQTGSSKDGSLSGDEGSDGANKQETEDSQSNCSKLSSDVTPSDERSNEEAGSSHKESNASEQHLKFHSPSSSNEQCSPLEDEEGMDDSEMNEHWDGFFQKLFTPLKVLVSRNPDKPSQPTGVPFWMSDAHMSQNVSMTYQMPTRTLEEVLEDDRRKLDHLSQSGTSKQQLLYLLKDSFPNVTPNSSSSSASISQQQHQQQKTVPKSSHQSVISSSSSSSIATNHLTQQVNPSIFPSSSFNQSMESRTLAKPNTQITFSNISTTSYKGNELNTECESNTPYTSHKQQQQQLSSHLSPQGESRIKTDPQKDGDGGNGVSSDTNSDPIAGGSIPDSSVSNSSSNSLAVNVESQLPAPFPPAINSNLVEVPKTDSFYQEILGAVTSDPKTTPGMPIEDLIMNKVFVSDAGAITRAMKTCLD